MNNTIKALIPALIAHLGLFLMAKFRVGQDLSLIVIVGILMVGGFLSAKYITDSIKQRNVDRSPFLTLGVGLIVLIIYVLTFLFSGCLLAVTMGL